MKPEDIRSSITYGEETAEMDLRIEKVNARTGELWTPKYSPEPRD